MQISSCTPQFRSPPAETEHHLMTNNTHMQQHIKQRHKHRNRQTLITDAHDTSRLYHIDKTLDTINHEMDFKETM